MTPTIEHLTLPRGAIHVVLATLILLKFLPGWSRAFGWRLLARSFWYLTLAHFGHPAYPFPVAIEGVGPLGPLCVQGMHAFLRGCLCSCDPNEPLFALRAGAGK